MDTSYNIVYMQIIYKHYFGNNDNNDNANNNNDNDIYIYTYSGLALLNTCTKDDQFVNIDCRSRFFPLLHFTQPTMLTL